MHQGYMVKFDARQYALSLRDRVGDAVVTGRAVIEGGDWQPRQNMCHHNATEWCELKPEFTPVRGWLYFDLPGLPNVRFVAHSVIRTPSGELSDITPHNATQDYPFLASGLTEEEFAHVVDELGIKELYAPKVGDA